jgi:cell division protease FtsH
MSSRPFAEQTQAKIDSEVSRLVREAEQRAVDVLTQHRSDLDRLADMLVERETVDGSVVYRLLGIPEAEGRGGGTQVAPHPRPRAAAAHSAENRQ